MWTRELMWLLSTLVAVLPSALTVMPFIRSCQIRYVKTFSIFFDFSGCDIVVSRFHVLGGSSCFTYDGRKSPRLNLRNDWRFGQADQRDKGSKFASYAKFWREHCTLIFGLINAFFRWLSCLWSIPSCLKPSALLSQKVSCCMVLQELGKRYSLERWRTILSVHSSVCLVPSLCRSSLAKEREWWVMSWQSFKRKLHSEVRYLKVLSCEGEISVATLTKQRWIYPSLVTENMFRHNYGVQYWNLADKMAKSSLIEKIDIGRWVTVFIDIRKQQAH